MHHFSEKASFVWSVADILPGNKQSNETAGEHLTPREVIRDLQAKTPGMLAEALV